MKIAIVNVQAPFVRGGAEYLADSLERKLRERGHRVEQIRVPFKWYPEAAVADHALSCLLMQLDARRIDQVIALKFPAYLIPFDNKRIWLLHQFRQMYDCWGTAFAGFADTAESRGLREVVKAADREALGNCKHLFSNSKIVAHRLKTFNDIDIHEVLYPPLDVPELFTEGPFESYVFYPSRLNEAKRQHVAIEAMRHVRSGVKLVLAGKADSDAYGERLRQLVEQWELQDRVQFLGWVEEAEKARWMASALAGIYLPYDEDSYGYVTLEAFQAHKPLLTFSDSGGTGEVMEDGRNGYVLPPEPEALAAAIDRLAADRPLARALGHEAFATLRRHRIEWGAVLDRLAG